MVKARKVRDILKEIADKYGIPEDITTVFYNKDTKEPIGYSLDDEDEPFIYVDMCSDINKIAEEYPDAATWDGWKGIIGHVGSRVVYNVEEAEERYFEDNNLDDISEAVEHWEFNVEGTKPYVPSYCRPYHMYEICQ